MTDYATIDASGAVLGFHNTQLMKPPADAIELTAEQYATWSQNPRGFLWHSPTKSLVAAPPRAPAEPSIPTVVTRFQLKAALIAMPGGESAKTLLDDVDAWAAVQSRVLQLTWSEAQHLSRGGPFVSQAAAHFAWSAAQLDSIFEAASAITT